MGLSGRREREFVIYYIGSTRKLCRPSVREPPSQGALGATRTSILISFSMQPPFPIR